MIVMDACSIINLANSGTLRRVANLAHHRLAVSPAVVGECNTGAAAQIIDLHADGLLDFVEIDDVPAGRFLELIELFGLGDGETESIAVAEDAGHSVCCDDRKARFAAAQLLGDGNVIGSLRLLRWAVDEDLLTTADSWQAYEAMKDAGGFLPSIAADFFG